MMNSTPNIPESPHHAATLKLNRVLVVDDVALNREIFTVHLGDAVRCVDEAVDGWDALMQFKLRHYDAILLDIEMPGLDGYDTLKELRAWEQERQLPLTPVVAVTASDFPEDEQRILAAGFSAYLLKPIKRQKLLSTLQVHCTVDPSQHPMASLLPKFFSYADVMLDELAGLQDIEAISKNLHKLRGMIAVYGFLEFAERLKQVHLRVKLGERPMSAEFEKLRMELQGLAVTP